MMKKRKLSKKGIIAIIVVLLAVLLLVILNPYVLDPIIYHLHDHHKLKDWQTGKYLELDYYGERASCMIPSAKDCNDYDRASFFWNNYGSWFFFVDYCQYAACLELRYNEATYATAKEKALASYHFLEEPVLEERGYGYKMPVTKTKIGSYTILIIKDKIYPSESEKNLKFTDYPHSFGFLAFHDEEMKIRYCYIDNSFLHWFDNSKKLIRYLKRNFMIGWN